MLNEYFESYLTRNEHYNKGNWCYEDGCIYRGLELLHRATGDERWIEHLIRKIELQIIDGASLKGYDPSAYNIDNILSGRALLYLYEVTADKRWLQLAGLLDDQLAWHPRTCSGVYWHKLRYPWQVWLDGLYMGAPFQIGYAQATQRPELIQDALQNVGQALNMTLNPNTGLYNHAVDEACKQPWADPTTGRSAAHWARALGWLAMGLVDIAALLPKDSFEPLREHTEALLGRIDSLRLDNGLWLQVIDRPDLQGNFEESSASAMFVYALLRGKKLGLHTNSVDGLFDLLVGKTIQPLPSGGHEMVNICWVAGLGMFEGRFRDGSAEYYLTEKCVSDDAKGVGPLMMCYAMHLGSIKACSN